MTQITPFYHSDFFKKNITYITVLIIAFVSYFNLGFLHPDEHFQILELINYKTSDHFQDHWLPWDVSGKLRSYLQPGIYLPVHLILKYLETSPFFIVFVLKFLTGFFSYKGLCFYLKNKTSNAHLFILFWFVPFVLCRTSSEALSSGFLFWGLYFIENEKIKNRFFYAGLLFGLCLYTRFAMLVIVATIALWFIIYGKIKLNQFLWTTLGVLIAVILGVGVDYWGYGEETFSLWNYFKANIIDKKGNQFGIEPFYYFLEKAPLKGGPIGIILFVTTFLFWRKNPRSLLTWWTVSFLLIHSLVSHKEVRFLIPVYLVTPYMFFEVIKSVNHKVLKRVIYLAFCINLIYGLKIMFSPQTTALKFYQYLYDHYEGKVQLYTVIDKHGTFLKLINRYYLKNNNIHLAATHDYQIKEKIIEKELLLVTSQKGELERHGLENYCQLIYSVYPKFLIEKNYFNWASRSSLWKLYQCSNISGNISK